MPGRRNCTTRSIGRGRNLLFERFVEGLTAFRRDYAGQLWIEVMLVKGLNDSEEALRAIATALQSIRPDQVHLNLPIRPPAEPWVQPVDETGLARALQVLGKVAHVVRPARGAIDLSGSENLRGAILSIITRHPLREADLQQTLGHWTASQIETALAELVAAGQAQIVTRYGTRFWSAAAAQYASKVTSRGH